jgi:hypothetical protein
MATVREKDIQHCLVGLAAAGFGPVLGQALAI